MKQLTLTTAGQLKPGDVFYKSEDANKTQFTVMPPPPSIVTKIYASRRSTIYAVKEGLHWPDPIIKNTEVVFLKHKKQ